MKRIGYVGLSTPTFYDYREQASRAPSDQASSPNPVIEGAFGALLLYDELWFLCRSLCPENMRHLPYVKFLDELGIAPDIDHEWLPEPEENFTPEALAHFHKSSAAYDVIKDQAKVYWEAAADNHTHGLKIGNRILNGNSWSVRNVMFDQIVVERLPQTVELVTNSFTSRLFKSEASTGSRLELTESLILNGVPQFLSPKGPYHPCIEEVRESRFLTNFREWIVKEAFASDDKEVAEIKEETERKLIETQRNYLLKYLDPRGSYFSFAETIVVDGVDALVPGVAIIKDLMGQSNEEKKKRELRWQGFILDAQQKLGK